MTRPLTRRSRISHEVLLPVCGEKVAEGRMRVSLEAAKAVNDLKRDLRQSEILRLIQDDEVIDLKTIYRRTLDWCAPNTLIKSVLRDHFPRTVVAIGKCAGALLDGFGDFDDALVLIPRGYPKPTANARVVEGGHPEITHDSFAAGRALLDFVDAHDEITFLVSGGGSACVEWPLEPFTQRELMDVNARLIRSGLPIGEINCVRKHLSAIKGGRLATGLKRSVTLVYSDVSAGVLADVASGPTLADPTTKEQASSILQRIGIPLNVREETVKHLSNSEVQLIADNDTLITTAATIARSMGYNPVMWNGQIESDVSVVAAALANAAEVLEQQHVLIAGGEPTVIQRGDGKGGRCSELAVRFACDVASPRLHALFGSSDGVDGNSGAAGVVIRVPLAADRDFMERELSRSNSMAVIDRVGEALPLCPTGNNLRDIYLLACS